MQDATDAIGELQMEEPIVAWTRADILRTAGADSPTLESAWRTAVDSSRSKGMRIFELRSTVGLARLLKRQGRSDEARAMLTDVYNWFTEGFDIADLQDAKKLLDELA
jgi:adenylate cyclase